MFSRCHSAAIDHWTPAIEDKANMLCIVCMNKYVRCLCVVVELCGAAVVHSFFTKSAFRQEIMNESRMIALIQVPTFAHMPLILAPDFCAHLLSFLKPRL